MKKLFELIKSKIQQLLGFGYSFLEKNSKVAVIVTQNLKEVVESNLLDFVVVAIPGEIDDKALVFIRKHMPAVAFKVGLIHKIVGQSDDAEQVIKNTIEYLRTLDLDARADFWIRFSAELTMALSDGKISLSEAIILSQMAYIEFLEKK